MLGVLLTVTLLNIPLSYKNGIAKGVVTRMEREEAALVLYTYESQSDESFRTLRCNNHETVRSLAPILEDLGDNVFTEPRAWAEIPKKD